MTCRAIITAFAFCTVLICVACSNSPGRPSPESAVIPPDEITDFSSLYGQNCAGCHGAEGKGGAAIALGDPVFLAIANDDVIRRTSSKGVSGTPMPAFAKSAGGMLTDKQIDVIVGGIRSWARPDALRNATPPPYAPQTPGDARHGETVYATYCASCHGPNGRGGEQGSSIVNPSYLALVSDQDLRSVVIAGRPEFGAPDWRNDRPGQPMSPQDVSDVVAWLSAQRTALPSYPNLAGGIR